MSPNDADGMANSVDPDQTAPRSSLIWVCTVCPGLSVRKLRIITVCHVETGLILKAKTEDQTCNPFVLNADYKADSIYK